MPAYLAQAYPSLNTPKYLAQQFRRRHKTQKIEPEMVR